MPRDYVLDGSSKLSVIFGKRPADKESCYTVLGVMVCYVEDFDIQKHMTQPVQDQQEAILIEMTNKMMEVARTSGADSDVVRKAADDVRGNDFSAEIEVKKLSRSTMDRRIRVEVFRCLGPLIGESWEARVPLGSRLQLGVEPIMDKPAYLDRTTHFGKSRWCGDVFQLIDNRLQKVQYELDITNYRKQRG